MEQQNMREIRIWNSIAVDYTVNTFQCVYIHTGYFVIIIK